MSDNEADATASPEPTAGSTPIAASTIRVTFEFAQGYQLVRGDKIVNFPSYVLQNTPIVIDPLPTGLDHAALQAAINRRASDLAVVAQALGLASSLLQDAISTLAGAS